MADHLFAGLRCADVLELSGAFVLGALSPEEASAVRQHLAECPEAHAEIAELGSVLPALFESVEPLAPPMGLKARILQAAAADTQRADDSQQASDTRPAVEPERTLKPFPEADTGRRGFNPGSIFRRPVWAAVAMAAVVAAVALGAWNIQLRNDLETLTAYREGVVEVLEEAARPGARLAVLTAPEDPAGPSGLVAVGGDGTVALVMRDLAPTTGTQVYEAWVIAGDNAPIPVGSFTVGNDRTASFTTAHPTAGPGITVALTLEPAAGATTPTMPIVALGTTEAAS